MDLQHPCTVIWDGTQTEVCAPQWTSCWTKEKCDSQKTDSSASIEEEESSDVEPKSNFNIDSLYLPMFLLTLYLNVNTSHH